MWRMGRIFWGCEGGVGVVGLIIVGLWCCGFVIVLPWRYMRERNLNASR